MSFSYTRKDRVRYVFSCFCCRRAHDPKKRVIYDKKHFLFNKGEKKMYYEIDIITLLRSMRQTRLLAQGILDQRQRTLLKFQRKNLIETSSSSENSDYNAKFDFPALMDSKDPKIRLSVYAKLKRMISSLKGAKLKTIDRRLLRGLFLRKLNDFDEDYREII